MSYYDIYDFVGTSPAKLRLWVGRNLIPGTPFEETSDTVQVVQKSGGIATFAGSKTKAGPTAATLAANSYTNTRTAAAGTAVGAVGGVVAAVLLTLLALGEGAAIK